MTTTVTASTLTTTYVTPTGTPSGGYVVVSPSSCPPSTPTGTLIGQSDQTFSANNDGLQYQQYSNSQFIIQNATSGPFFVDLSSSSSVTISDTDGDTLTIYANGTFEAFAGSCEIEIVGSLLASSSKSKAKRKELERRQSSELCNDVQLFCNSRIGVFLEGAAGGALCLFLGGEIGADIGGGIGFLGNILGPEVGIPTTLLGVVLGGRLGAFLASKIGSTLCSGATSLLGDALCKACPSSVSCGVGTISCNGGPCQDALSDPNNCGACGNVVSAVPILHSSQVVVSVMANNLCSVLPESVQTANALLQPATDQHAVASTAVVLTAFALRHLTAQDSAVLISPATRSQTALLALTALKGRSALLALAVGETCV